MVTHPIKSARAQLHIARLPRRAHTHSYTHIHSHTLFRPEYMSCLAVGSSSSRHTQPTIYKYTSMTTHKHLMATAATRDILHWMGFCICFCLTEFCFCLTELRITHSRHLLKVSRPLRAAPGPIPTRFLFVTILEYANTSAT
jgi:hypothetical protein